MTLATATLEAFFAPSRDAVPAAPVPAECASGPRGEHAWQLMLDPHPDEEARWVFDGFRCRQCGTGLFPWDVDGWPFGRLHVAEDEVQEG